MICKICKIEKESTEFYNIGSKKDISCRLCRLAKTRKRERSESGFIKRLYHNQIKSSKVRSMEAPSYSLEELKIFMYNNGYKEMYIAWCNSDYDMDFSPSIDRTDRTKSYTIDNIQLIKWKENNAKGNKEKRVKVKIIYDNGEVIEAKSIDEASIILTVTKATIHRSLNKTGYIKRRRASLVRV